MEMNEDLARRFMGLGLGHVTREYPNKLGHVLHSDRDARTPRDLHPAFYGSYDWHSCVHSWWMLLSLRREYPGTPESAQVEVLANATFTAEKLAAELALFESPQGAGFERPYGWGWLLYLHLEAGAHGGKDWAKRLEPLTRCIAGKLRGYLGRLTYPITVGTHFNTAFALLLACEWAQEHDPELLSIILKWSKEVFENKSDYGGWEPGGDDFLSPVLTAALLMRRVLEPDRFALWFDRLVIANGWLDRECKPVIVSDRSDGKIAHLDGLNLSRAWCMREIAASLDAMPQVRALLERKADEHLAASLPHVSGEYMGEHWLASFALLALRSQG